MESTALLAEGLRQFGITAGAEACEAILKHLELVRSWNERVNLTAITGEQEMVVKHALDSAAGLTVAGLAPGTRVLDVGTGAGFPGVVWKCLVPGIDLVLLESLQKRCRFLEEVGEQVVRPLAGGTAGYTVVWGRAEDAGRDPAHRERYDVVTARAVAQLRVLTEYCLPFVRVGGIFVAMKGPGVEAEMEEARAALDRLGGKVDGVYGLELPEDGGSRSLVVVRKVRSTSWAYPRKAGTPARHPL